MNQRKVLERQIQADKDKEKRLLLYEKYNRILRHIEEFAKVTQLYRLKSGMTSQVVKDENGNYIPGEDGRFKVDKRYFQSDPEILQAIKDIQGADLVTLISHQKVIVHNSEGEVLDLVMEIDPTGEIKQLFTDLWRVSIYEIGILEKHAEALGFDYVVTNLVRFYKEAEEIRINIREKLKLALERQL